MEELKALLGMDLPDEAKALLAKVNTSYSEKEDAVANFMKTIDSKTNAIEEMTAQRATLKTELAEAKAERGGNKDNSNEQIEKNNAEWSGKYGELESKYKGLKTDVAEKNRLNEFNSLNIGSKFPESYTDAQRDFAMKAIQESVFNGSVYDENSDVWGYGKVGGFDLNINEGKAFSIASKTKSMIDAGSFDMFFAGSQGSGGGSVPSATPAQTTQSTSMNATEMMKQGRK